MARILVTGGCGFIGSALVRKLALTHEVSVLDIRQPTERVSNVNYLIQDVNSPVSISHKLDYIFHLAAHVNLRESLDKPSEDARTNILGSIKMIELALEHGAHFIFASSAAVYDALAPLPVSEHSPLSPSSPYGLAKLSVEQYIRILGETRGLKSTILRYANAYGPGQVVTQGEGAVIPLFIQALLHEKSLTVFGDGEQTRDFVYVEDIVEATILGMTLEGTFNVSSESELSVNQLVEYLGLVSGLRASVTRVPGRAGELIRSVLSSAALRSKGWKPAVSFEEGLRTTVNWHRSLML